MAYLLGLNLYFHDASACLMRDGRLVAAVEEERYTRRKHTTEFPSQAVTAVLAEGGVASAEIDHVAVSADPELHRWRKLAYAASHPWGARTFAQAELGRYLRAKSRLRRWLASTWPDPGRRPKVHFVPHHLCHAPGSFLVSPYEEAALLGLDGAGEWATSFLGVGRGRRIERLHQSYFPMSLGSFYEAATEFCGFRPNYDEGKTMGLAPYGDPTTFGREVADMLRIDEEGGIHVDLSYFSFAFQGWQRCGPKFYEVFGPPRMPGQEFSDRHRDVAAAFQHVLEARVLELCSILHARTGCKHVVLGGGVALNSVVNGRIVRESPFEDVYVMPGAGDNGTCIGAAAYVEHVTLDNPRVEVHDDPYVGRAYSSDEIEAALRSSLLPVERCDDVTAVAARWLHEGQILAWFQGRMEFGPRSLGNRTILADPTRAEMKDVLNARVKHREPFRPFAPAVLAEHASEFFVTDVDAPFMLKVCPVRPERRKCLPAVTHADGSARVQTVHHRLNPRFHALIREFHALSGVPVVLNTSFNVMGEPIVESPLQAIRCFFSTGLDALVLGDYLVRKPA